MRTVVLTSVAIAALTGACGGGSAEDSVRSLVADSAGIRIVTAPATDAPPPWVPETMCRFGGPDAGPEAFTRADQSAVTTDGADRIYVLRPETRTIEVFDATCRHLTTLGRAGDGPGELRTPTALAVTSEGEVQVFDAAKQARLRWGRNDSVLSPIPWDGAMSLPNGPLKLEGGRAVFLSARGGGGTMTHLLTALEGERIGPCTLPIEELIAEVGLAPARPALRTVTVDDRQQLWVERWGFPDEPPVTDLYTGEGQYRGTFTDLAAPLGSLGGGRVVVPVRDAATDLVRLVVLTGGARDEGR